MFWAELTTPDPDAAESFYAALLGWEMETVSTGPGPPRRSFRQGPNGVPVAGLSAMSPWQEQQGEAARWTPFLHTPDAVAMTERAQFHGATLLEPAMPAHGHGWRALLADPTGAEFGVWEPAESRPAPPPTPAETPSPGTLGWAELQTTDAYAARDFYRELLVWSCKDDHPNPDFLGDDIRFIQHNQPVARLRPVQRVDVPDAPRWLPGFAVEDLATAAQTAESLGGTVSPPPGARDGETPRVMVLSGPTGADCLLVHV
jgi:hypothetical protein